MSTQGTPSEPEEGGTRFCGACRKPFPDDVYFLPLSGLVACPHCQTVRDWTWSAFDAEQHALAQKVEQ